MASSIFKFQDCYATWDYPTLVVGNASIERTWDMSAGMPLSASLLNKADETEWLSANAARRKPACSVPDWGTDKPSAVTVHYDTDDDFGIGAEHLRVTVLLDWGARQLKLEHLVYPGIGWIRSRVSLRRVPEMEQVGRSESRAAAEESAAADTAAAGMDTNALPTTMARHTDYMEALPLEPFHMRWQAVELRDVTDTNNNLLSLEEGLLYTNDRRKLRGNLLLLQETLRPTGLLVVKEGPTAHGHLQDAGSDFLFDHRLLFVTGGGLIPSDLLQEEWIPLYGTATGVWAGGEYEALRLLNALHEGIRVSRPERDFFLMCNNWGDRNRDGRMSEDFVLGELRRAAELGVTNVQLDDGWQHGNTTNSVNPAGGRWSDYYADGDGFWNVHPERFPNGFEPLEETAARLNLRIALWFSPDSAYDFANWAKDAERLLAMHRSFGVCYFKLDGIKIRSKLGENRLVRMMQTVVRETGGRVYFNLDATNEVRLGFYGRTQYGGLFLENRYTDFRSYYPHWTLRNLWQMAKYVPAQKLQMEVLNVERNRHVYGDDPLAPDRCGIGYAFAAVMFTNPLIWMELTGLSSDNAAILKRALDVYNRHQHRILGGHVLPIGEAPDGTSWTGFQSVTGDGEGYVLVFRELSPEPAATLRLWGLSSSSEGQAHLRLKPLLLMEERNQLVPGDTLDEFDVPLTPAREGAGVKMSLRNPLSFGLYTYKLQEGEND